MIDATRHSDIFDPGVFGDRRVDVIGTGATGSKVALAVAKLGVRNLHVWDFDQVEPHNLANQAFAERHLGMNKAEAAAQVVYEATGWPVTAHAKAYEGEPLGEFVFALPDSMAARRLVFDSLRFSMTAKRVFESRLGVGEGQLYNYVPTDPADRTRYEATLFSDDEANVPVSACGTTISVGPTGDVLVGMMVWQFIQAVNGEQKLPWLAISAKGGYTAEIG